MSGAPFLVGVASLGLLTVRAAVGHGHEALAGFEEVVEYFARTGTWTHQLRGKLPPIKDSAGS